MSELRRMIQVVSQYPATLGGASLGEVAREWLAAGFTPDQADRCLARGQVEPSEVCPTCEGQHAACTECGRGL